MTAIVDLDLDIPNMQKSTYINIEFNNSNNCARPTKKKVALQKPSKGQIGASKLPTYCCCPTLNSLIARKKKIVNH